MQKEEIDPKIRLAKHDLINERQNISFLVLNVRANWLREKEKRREEKEKKKEEKKKRSARKAKVWKSCMESTYVWKLKGIYICLDYVWIISMKKNVWNGMELMFRSVVSWFKLDLWFLFQKGCVLVERIPMKMAKKWQFMFCLTPLRLGVRVHA